MVNLSYPKKYLHKTVETVHIVYERESNGWYAWFSDWFCANYKHLWCYNGWQQCCRSRPRICPVLLHSCTSGISPRRLCNISGNTLDKYFVWKLFFILKFCEKSNLCALKWCRSYKSCFIKFKNFVKDTANM